MASTIFWLFEVCGGLDAVIASGPYFDYENDFSQKMLHYSG